MPPSIGLTLYNLGQRREPGADVPRPPRPAGRLAWLHAPTLEASRTLLALARRLVEDDGIPVLLTCPADLPPREGVILQPPPSDTPLEAREFLDHWKPEIAIFAEGELRPAILSKAVERKIPLLMVDARAPSLPHGRDGWFPGLMRTALGAFHHVSALDEAAARAFRKAGAAISAVAVTGRMEEESAALPCLEAERAALARLLAARPVWFAACLPEAEEAAVLAAHRTGLQQAHRLLLILMPDDITRAEALAARIEADEGWAVALRSRDEEPDPETEVFIVDNPAEYGLWYRLSPVSFLGGSLVGLGSLRDPQEAAALGSAILHGPHHGQFRPFFARLIAARAARPVIRPDQLGDALGEVLALDRTARFAQSAWAVATDGAEVTEATVERIRRLMDGEA
ncbi:3-deoxy-D-manno-octulosonic acid transferase [Tabrizicola sp. BL-A-41-H6]|uniref:3-deoxy-D-manno-octulosonic acid transferase n=1 Tax=Tabrizicola sp. BL-A-41-H6 TaxID=3421107 RepID=UPI003D679041